jgi:hypothetical protein
MIPLRTGGMGGLADLAFGQVAEVGERRWTVAVFLCVSCGHVDLYDPQRVRADA